MQKIQKKIQRTLLLILQLDFKSQKEKAIRYRMAFSF